MSKFADAKQRFDEDFGKRGILPESLVPVDGKYIKSINIRNSSGEPTEEYYKWQFIYALINSGLYARDYLGTEVRFPKGNKTSNPLKMDAALF